MVFDVEGRTPLQNTRVLNPAVAPAAAGAKFAPDIFSGHFFERLEREALRLVVVVDLWQGGASRNVD